MNKKPRNASYEICVFGVIVNNRDEVLTLQYSNYSGPYTYRKWVMPSGRLKMGENPEDGVKREIYEETKLKVKKVCLAFADTVLFGFDNQTRLLLVYLCLNPVGSVRLGEEHINYEWVKPEILSQKTWINDYLPAWVERALKMKELIDSKRT